MSKHIKKANIIIVIVSIVLLLVIAGVVGFEYMKVNDINIKEEILIKLKK